MGMMKRGSVMFQYVGNATLPCKRTAEYACNHPACSCTMVVTVRVEDELPEGFNYCPSCSSTGRLDR